MIGVAGAMLLVTAVSVGARAQANPGQSARAILQQSAPTLALVRVNVLPMDREHLLTDQTLIVKNGKIVEMGPSSVIHPPPDAVQVDGDDHWVVMPGLADMHAHLRYESDLLLLVANGVTTVRNMRGTPFHLELRRRVEDGTILGPHIVTAGPILNGEGNARTPDEATRLVNEQAAAGYDFIKVYDGLSKEAYEAIMSAAKAKGLKVAGHVPTAVGVEGALAAHQASIEHAEQFIYHFFGDRRSPYSAFDLDPAMIPAIARRTAAAGTSVTPTLTIIDSLVSQVEDRQHILNEPELKYLEPETYAWWQTSEKSGSGINQSISMFQKKLVAGLQDAGVELLAGTDFYVFGLMPGFSLHRELHSLVEAGLSPYQAIAAATRNPARYLGRSSHSGAVAVGFDADLLIVKGNPLQHIEAVDEVEGVVLRGRWLPQKELASRLEAAAVASAPAHRLVDAVLKNGATAAEASQTATGAVRGDLDEDTLTLLGYFFLRQKRFSDSVALFKLAVSHSPRSANAYDSLGDAYVGAGQIDDARKSYQRALELNPAAQETRGKLKKLGSMNH
jgi:imidazolonepropionase-like amidohydrolase